MRQPPIPMDRVEIYESREDWLRGRRAGEHRVGASDVGAILGCSQHRRPWDVWCERQGLTPPVDAAQERTFARGHRYELRALQDFAEESGTYVCQPRAVWAPENNDAQVIVVHGAEPWATCTPDGLTLTPGARTAWGGAEAKTSSAPRAWGPTQVIERWDDALAAVIPAHYAAQCYWSLECTGLPTWTLVVLLPWYEVRWYVIHRDEEMQRALVDTVGAWRERHLVRGEAPAITGDAACGRWLAQQHPGGAGPRAATDREAAVVRRMRELARMARETERERDLLRHLLAASIGDAARILLPNGGSYTPRRSGSPAPQQDDDADVDPLDFGCLL